MTAAIVGLTLVVAGPATHRRRYTDGRAWWHCSATDGECLGHARPVLPHPDQRPCPRGHTGAWKSDNNGWRVCQTCRQDQRADRTQRQREARARFNNSHRRTA